MRDGKLIYAPGFGYADVKNKALVQPDALFRIASVFKTLTADAIMKLVEEGKRAGWFVRPTRGDANWWPGGSLPGATAMLVRTYDNVAWIGLFNGRVVTPTTNSEPELDATLGKAFEGVTSFPTHDLFPTFR